MQRFGFALALSLTCTRKTYPSRHMMLLSISWLLLCLAAQSTVAFLVPRTSSLVLLRTSHVASSFDDWSLEDLQSFRQGKDRQAVVQAVVNSTSSLLQMHLVGQTELATSRNTTTPCLVLSNIPGHDSPRDGLCLPITKNNLKLLSFAVRDAPLTKSVLLGINSLLVNRDDGLFDNLPWDSWTVDPMKRNRDAASNFIAKKFHMGKRDAYNVMMGKDWKGRSFSIGNLAMRAKFMLSTGESEKGTIAVWAPFKIRTLIILKGRISSTIFTFKSVL